MHTAEEDSNLTSATAAPVASDSEDEGVSRSAMAAVVREHSDDLEMRFLQARWGVPCQGVRPHACSARMTARG